MGNVKRGMSIELSFIENKEIKQQRKALQNTKEAKVGGKAKVEAINNIERKQWQQHACGW